MNTTPRIGFLIAGLACTAVLSAGCMNLEPRPDPTQLYTLNGPDLPPFENDGSLRVGLRPIDIPAYLDTTKIVTRRGKNQIVRSEFHRWADGFESSVKRAVGEHLAAQAGIRDVRVYPWVEAPVFGITVKLWILRFEGTEDGTVRLDANWQIEDPAGIKEFPLESTRLAGAWTPGDYGSLVVEMDRLLGRWAADVAARM